MTTVKALLAATLLALAGCATAPHPVAKAPPKHRVGAEVGSYPLAQAPFSGAERLVGDQNGITSNFTPAQLSQYFGTYAVNNGLIYQLLPPLSASQCLTNNGTTISWGTCGGATFDQIGSGVNTQATMTISTGAQLTYSGTGTINASTLGNTTFAAPGPIGSVSPGTGAFTNLTAGGQLGISSITGSTQCLHVNSTGIVSGTGSDCPSGGSGTVNNGTGGDLAYYATTGTAVSQLPVGAGLSISNSTLLAVQAGRTVTTTSDTINCASDAAKLITYNNASAVGVSLPAPTGACGPGFALDIQNYGTGTVTVTPASGLMGGSSGSSTLAIPANSGCSISTISTDTSNYQVSACTALLGTFAFQNYATPPAIGGSTPAAGNFTTLGATSTLTTNVTGSTQCLHVNTSGVVSGTGADCGGAASVHTSIGFNCAAISQSSTEYCATGSFGLATGATAPALFALNGTVKNLYVATVNTPPSGQTYTITLYTGAPGSLSASAVTCQVSNAGGAHCSDVTDSATVSAGNGYMVKIVTSATSGTTGAISFAFEFDPS